MIVHCRTEQEAIEILEAILKRLEECELRLNKQKTKLVYCKDYRRKQKNDYVKKFDFLGFTFNPQSILVKGVGMMVFYKLWD